MATFFTGDSHYGHRNIVEKFARPRPFADIDAHDEALVERWNAVVGPEDECWHLGDFSYKCPPKRMRWLFGRLNGRKHLIMGNHDTAETASLGWASVQDIKQLSVDGTWLVLLHYPMRSWPGMHRGSVHLYGHAHGSMPGIGRSMDVGVDAHSWAPVSLDEVRARMLAIPKSGRQDEAA